MKNGIIVIDKPKDFTSHDVVAKSRGILKTKRIGHAGTLDPMATGVLPLFLGSATRAISRMADHDKGYIATIKLGLTTDTQDITGKVLTTSNLNVTKAEFEKVLMSFVGEQEQLPPMYSAIQVEGQRLYDIARRGEEIERLARPITVKSIQLTDENEQAGEYTFEVYCSQGTYIRTICHDIGEKLGCGGVLSSLIRVYSNGFTLKDTVTIDQLQQLADTNRVDEIIRPVESVFEHYPKVEIPTETLVKHFINGVPLWLNQLDVKAEDQTVAVYYNNSFLGLAKADKKQKQLTQHTLFNREW